MTQFEITYIFRNKIKSYWTKASDGFSAECEFLKWAGRACLAPVRVVRVERVAV